MTTIGTITITFTRTEQGVEIMKEYNGVSPYEIVAVGNVLTMEGLDRIKQQNVTTDSDKEMD